MGININADTHRAVAARFDGLAPDRARWQKRARCYYEDQLKMIRFLVPPGLRVLEIGCGLGDLLEAVRPTRGVGVDLSPGLVERARARYPQFEFNVSAGEEYVSQEKFDVVLLVDVVGQLADIQKTFGQVRSVCHEGTRVVIGYYNFLWEPVLRLLEAIGLKMPQGNQNWLAPSDISNLLTLSGFEVVKTEQRLLVPARLGGLGSFINRFFSGFWGLRRLCLSQYIVARPVPPPPEVPCGVSVIVPCRNERGNITEIVDRIPEMGTGTEIVFVEGGSSDGTLEEIRRVIAERPERSMRVFVQTGVGKGDAVRLGFAEARHDVLMILDADLTVPPEDLPKFYGAIARRQGEFINGTRLVYPMEKQAMRLLNLLGNKFFSAAFSGLLNQRIRDTLCGTKVIRSTDYHRLAADRAYFGDFDPFGDFDLLFGASRLNLKIIEIPIRYRERRYGTTNIQRFAHGWLLLKMVVFAFFKLKAF